MTRQDTRSGRRWFLIVGGVVLVALIAAGALFQPWKLVTDVEVSDSDPFAEAAGPGTPTSTAAGVTPDPAGSGGSGGAPVVRAGGSFTSIAHPTSGTVKLGTGADGSPLLFLEDLDTDNGPDLKLFLSRTPAGGDAKAYGTDPLDLGALKGNRGDQVYNIPPTADLGSYRSVVIWCERFSVGFGVAPLDPT
jgi:hypothetical protein